MTPHRAARAHGALQAAQRGISLLFSLFALVILGLAAVALTRSVDTGALIMGNLGFKQDTVVASANGTEQALAWLQTNINTAVLDAAVPVSGYYASALDEIDVTGNQTSTSFPMAIINWDGSCMGLPSGAYTTCSTTPYTSPTPVNGNTIKWVITRLCDNSGVASGANLCIRPTVSTTSTAVERGELTPGGRISGGIASPFFRIIVRTEGPRNTVTYTESLVHF